MCAQLKNTHLDSVRSLDPLQIARKPHQPVIKEKDSIVLTFSNMRCHARPFGESAERLVSRVQFPLSSSLILLTSVTISVGFRCLLVSLQYRYISGGNVVLNMHQGYLGHVIHVTKATGGAYIACAVCFPRVSGCTCCGDPEIMLQH